MTYNPAVESRISDAMAAGLFDNLPGAGEPLAGREEEQLAGDLWLGYKLLRDNNLLPPWLMLAREIERDIEELKGLDVGHATLVKRASDSGDWSGLTAAIRLQRARFAALAAAIRVKQDRLNYDAPSILVERPGLWVAREVERLDARVRAAGAPDELLGGSA